MPKAICAPITGVSRVPALGPEAIRRDTWIQAGRPRCHPIGRRPEIEVDHRKIGGLEEGRSSTTACFPMVLRFPAVSSLRRYTFRVFRVFRGESSVAGRPCSGQRPSDSRCAWRFLPSGPAPTNEGVDQSRAQIGGSVDSLIRRSPTTAGRYSRPTTRLRRPTPKGPGRATGCP